MTIEKPFKFSVKMDEIRDFIIRIENLRPKRSHSPPKIPDDPIAKCPEKTIKKKSNDSIKVNISDRRNRPPNDWEDKYRTVNGTSESECIYCRKILSNPEHFKRHYLGCHKGKRFRCPGCGLERKCKKTYSRHVPKCHGDMSVLPAIVYEQKFDA